MNRLAKRSRGSVERPDGRVWSRDALLEGRIGHDDALELIRSKDLMEREGHGPYRSCRKRVHLEPEVERSLVRRICSSDRKDSVEKAVASISIPASVALVIHAASQGLVHLAIPGLFLSMFLIRFAWGYSRAPGRGTRQRALQALAHGDLETPQMRELVLRASDLRSGRLGAWQISRFARKEEGLEEGMRGDLMELSASMRQVLALERHGSGAQDTPLERQDAWDALCDARMRLDEARERIAYRGRGGDRDGDA